MDIRSESHPSFRFSIGERIELDLADPDETKGHPQWIPGTIRGFNANNGTYDILLDYPVGQHHTVDRMHFLY